MTCEDIRVLGMKSDGNVTRAEAAALVVHMMKCQECLAIGQRMRDEENSRMTPEEIEQRNRWAREQIAAIRADRECHAI